MRKISKSRRRIAVMLAALSTGLLATPGHAVVKNWNVGSGLWGTSANWSPAAVPTASDIVQLNRLVSGQRGIVTVSGTGFASPISVSIRQSNELNIANNSALSVGGDVIVGYGDAFGILNANGVNGSLTVGNTLRLGFESSLGVVNQNNGTVRANQLVRVGDRHSTSIIFPGSGRYNLSGAGRLDAARLEVGYGGDSSQFACEGTFNLSGGVLDISLGAQIPDPKIGGGGGTGVFNQTGGTVNSPFRILSIGGNTGPGTYNFSGGVFNGVGMFLGTTGTLNYTAGSNLSVGQLSTANGNVNVSSGGGKVLRTTVLFTSAGQWAVDLNDNAMVVSSTFGETVQSALDRGYNNGSWNGNGIRSTAAAAAASTSVRTALGYALAGDVGITTLNGQAVTSTSTVIRYTFAGDASLDRAVNSDDFNRLAVNFGSAGKGWSQGDFNYDQIVSSLDFNLMAGNFGLSAGADGIVDPEDWAALAAAAPEPSTGLLLLSGLATSVASARRRGVARELARGGRATVAAGKPGASATFPRRAHFGAWRIIPCAAQFSSALSCCLRRLYSQSRQPRPPSLDLVSSSFQSIGPAC